MLDFYLYNVTQSINGTFDVGRDILLMTLTTPLGHHYICHVILLIAVI